MRKSNFILLNDIQIKPLTSLSSSLFFPTHHLAKQARNTLLCKGTNSPTKLGLSWPDYFWRVLTARLFHLQLDFNLNFREFRDLLHGPLRDSVIHREDESSYNWFLDFLLSSTYFSPWRFLECMFAMLPKVLGVDLLWHHLGTTFLNYWDAI